MDEKWQARIEELEAKRDRLELGGGEARLAKQHERGKLTARERMEALFDGDSFIELNDMLSSRATDFGMEKKRVPGDGVVVGYGYVHGRIAFAASQDFTVSGGALGEAHAKKICNAMDMAAEVGAPFISINDSGGSRIEEGIDSLSGYGDIFYRNATLSGVIPQICVLLGPCAGGASYSPALCDFIFMNSATSQMYITGTQVTKSVTGEEISANDLGGAEVHATKSGTVHFVYDNDLDCLNGVRRLLGYLPQNCNEMPMTIPSRGVDECASIPSIVPSNTKASYDVRDVIATFVDDGSMMEVLPHFARNLVTCFARIDGKSVGIVANQSMYLAGSLDLDASDKGARFIRFCDCFNIPLLTLVDVPAFMPGSSQEHRGIIRHGAKLLFAYSEATVPKVTLLMRKAYGGAYVAMSSKGLRADVVFAWPIAEVAVMGADGAIAIIGRRAIAEAEDKEARRREMVEEYNEKFMTPYIAVEHGQVDEVILPEETRSRLSQALRMLEGKKAEVRHKKHGNIPL